MRFLAQATRVPSADARYVTIEPGEEWPLPYRGSRYSLKSNGGGGSDFFWTYQGTAMKAVRLPDGLCDAFLECRGGALGRLVFTAHGEVLTRLRSGARWTTLFVGSVEGELQFEHFQLNPAGLEPGHLWPGLHFHHGECWTVGTGIRKRNLLRWSLEGESFFSTEPYPDLCRLVREIRPNGGRVYITEHGHVWMNLPPEQVSDEWHNRILGCLAEDRALLEANETLLQSIRIRTEHTRCWPIYLGPIRQFDSGQPPRTRFHSSATFDIPSDEPLQ
jgi:hypothetical protein